MVRVLVVRMAVRSAGDDIVGNAAHRVSSRKSEPLLLRVDECVESRAKPDDSTRQILEEPGITVTCAPP
jgi:hypothetical protein